MKIKHEFKKESVKVSKTDYYVAEIEGCDVIFQQYEDGRAEVSICPKLTEIPVGIIRFHPKNRQSIIDFSKSAQKVFKGVGEMLTQIDKDDFRDQYERLMDQREHGSDRRVE